MSGEPMLAPAVRIPLAGLVAWLLPGLGHVLIGDRRRGVIVAVTLATTFWGGLAIGGVRNTVDPQHKKLWFMAQICNGGHTIIAYAWGAKSREGLSEAQLADSRWKSAEIGLVYTGVAGLLNLLVIMDVLVRADASHGQPTRRSKARAPAGVT